MMTLQLERLHARVSALLAVLAVVLVAACKQGSTEKEPATQLHPLATAEAIELPPYEPEPFEVRTITRSDDLGPPFEELRFRPTLTLAKGRSLRIGQRELPGDRVVIYEGNGEGTPETGRLYATDTGEVLAEFQRLWRVSAENNVADVTDAEGHRHLLHLETGRLIRVTPQVPKGTVAETRLIFFPPPMSWVWLFARTAGDEVYHAQWQNLDQPPPSLDETFPIWPMLLEQKSLVLRSSGGSRSGCSSASFYPDGTYRCEVGIADYALASGYIRFGLEKSVGKTRDAARPFPSCEAIGGGDWFAGERLIRYCPGPGELDTTLAVWAPDRVGSVVASAPLPRLMSEFDSPILVAAPSSSGRVDWFDLEHFVHYQTDPLWPFVDGGEGERRMIVVSDSNYSETLLLDLRAERLSRISRRTGCYAYEWWFVREWGVGVQCLDRRRVLLHTEFVDFDRRVVVRVFSSDVWFDGNRNVVAATRNGGGISVMRLD